LNDYGQIDLGAAATERACDAITLEIVRGALRATQSEMEALIERTAMSPFTREKKDFYAALFDGEGRLIVGSNLPIFGDAIGPILERYPRATMREGDIYWYNDCYASHGAVSHSPDQVFACPVFYGEEIVAFATVSTAIAITHLCCSGGPVEGPCWHSTAATNASHVIYDSSL
jgi:N-methylhydantoinase B/oxoprolinase/acetone carboxylase alpha subunit